MKSKAVSGIMLTLLLIAILTLAFNIEPFRASGNFHIKADESVNLLTAPISTVDNIEYESTPDVAVLGAGPARMRIPDPLLGMVIPVFVAVENQGSWIETFEVSAFYDTTLIGKLTTDLQAGGETWYSFGWDLGSLPNGVYTISANASVLPEETDTADNYFVNGEALKTIFADVTGDGIVDVFDLFYLGKAYESTTLSADLNSDGIVNYTDVYIMSIAAYPYPDSIWNPYADLDGDGNVDYDDFLILTSNFGFTGAPNWNLHADMNADNEVGLPDLLDLSKNYGKTV